MKEDDQKALKKVISFFLSNPLPFNRQKYQKQIVHGTSDSVTSRYSGCETSSEKFLYLLASYVLSDQVWWCNIKRVLIYSKNYICKFKQAKFWQIIPLPFAILNLECAEGWEKVTKIWISWEQKDLFRWNKKHLS